MNQQILDEATILEHNRKVISEGIDEPIWRNLNESPEERLLKDVMAFGGDMDDDSFEGDSNDDSFSDDGDGFGSKTVAEYAMEITESPGLARRVLRFLASKGFDSEDDASSVPRNIWRGARKYSIKSEIESAQPRPRRIMRPAMESCVMGSNLMGESGYGRAILREMFEDEADEGFGGETIEDRARSSIESDYLANLTIRRLERMGYDRDDDANSVPSKVWNHVLGFAINNAIDSETPVRAAGTENTEGGEATEGIDSVPAMESTGTNVGDGMEKPPVKPQECNLTPKRNRRLHSRTRNIQLWDKSKNAFAPEYTNTRFNRMKDANEAISRISASK